MLTKLQEQQKVDSLFHAYVVLIRLQCTYIYRIANVNNNNNKMVQVLISRLVPGSDFQLALIHGSW